MQPHESTVPGREAERNEQGANNGEEPATGEQPTQRSGDSPSYARFGLMIVTSTIVMFGLTYTNSYSIEHVRWSEERFYMALLMGSAMATIMLGFMWTMYRHGIVNILIIAFALGLGAFALWLSQSQHFVDDRAYMRGMIPHHSIAILTSERADLDDLRVRELADEISEAQRREIKEMDWLIEDINENGPATTEAEARARRVPDFGAGE